jgi:phosphate acetyltransferase/phosphate butyryltransferase
LGGAGRITHTFIFDLPRYPKLLAVTDAVVNIAPDVSTKADAIANSVRLLGQLGIPNPKVAILAAVETVHESIPATVDARTLVAFALSGRFGPAIVEGPFGFDNAVSAEAAASKGIVSAVAGDPDLLVVPDLNSGNMLYKSFVYMGGGECAGLVLGARVPVILTSRADSHFSRIASCALASIASSAH